MLKAIIIAALVLLPTGALSTNVYKTSDVVNTRSADVNQKPVVFTSSTPAPVTNSPESPQKPVVTEGTDPSTGEPQVVSTPQPSQEKQEKEQAQLSSLSSAPPPQPGYQQYCSDGVQAQGSCETPVGMK